MKTIFVQEHIGPTIFELPYLDDAIVLEIRPGIGEKPKAFCTGCKTNWACLFTEIDNEGEEFYDMCPVCKTDANLENYHADEDGFIMNPFTGEIKNINSNALPVKDVINDIVPVEIKPFDREAHEARKEREQALHDLAIDEYQTVYLLSGQQNAEAAFFKKVQELKGKK